MGKRLLLQCSVKVIWLILKISVRESIMRTLKVLMNLFY